jgi:hypothetical protein
MVKKLGILGIILVVVAAAAGMVWAESFTGAIPAPQPMVMPASAPACVGGPCAPAPAKVVPMKPKKLTTAIEVKLQYPQPAAPVCGPMMGCQAGPPPIPVAVPMWKFIVPWPPFVYYLPVE